jgi:hypothetical protein
MVGDKRTEEGVYGDGPQEKGVPYYFHQDNEGFTGNEANTGWDFGNPKKQHAIAVPGAELIARQLVQSQHHETFARYVIDRAAYTRVAEALARNETIETNSPLRPVNADTFLLISAGPDGRYGTPDDVSNLPPWVD